MRAKIAGMFSLCIIYILVVIPIVSANSPLEKIDERKALSYHYTVIKEQNTFTWKVGNQDKIAHIVENEDNTEKLLSFRKAVNEIKTKIFQIILSVSYILLIVITTLFFHKKKQMNKVSGVIIIIIFAAIGIVYTIVNFIYLNTAFQDAKFYYSILTD